MLAIAILLLVSSVVTIVAMIAASPLFRTITLAIDSWADSTHGEGEQPS